MPTKVRIKVTLLIALACLPLLGLARLEADVAWRAAAALAYVAGGLYVVWCFWPRWTWGLSVSWAGSVTAAGGGPRYLLSFDDGPTPGLTDQVLDLLKDYGQRAHFFVLVSKAEQAPQLIRRMIAEGHVVGLHGWDHRKPFFCDKARIKHHLGPAKARLEALTGGPVRLYRPSHGWKNIALVGAVRELGLDFCFWDHGVWDTDNPSREALVSRLLAAAARAPAHRPVTLLLHDGRGDAPGIPDHGQAMLLGLKAFLDEKTRP